MKIEKLSKGGYRLTLPENFSWDPVDTVIVLTAGNDSGLDVVDNDDGRMDFDKYTVILKDGKAYVRKGTTYAQMAAYLEKSGEYIATFINAEGTDEIGSDNPLWNTAAQEGMVLRLIKSDYSDMVDYIITPVSEQDTTDPGKSPNTGESHKTTAVTMLLALAGLSIVIFNIRRQRELSYPANH